MNLRTARTRVLIGLTALVCIIGTVVVPTAADAADNPAVDLWYANVFLPSSSRLLADNGALDLTGLIDGDGYLQPCADLAATAQAAQASHAPTIDLQVPWQAATDDFKTAGKECITDYGSSLEMQPWDLMMKGMKIFISMDRLLSVRYGIATGYIPPKGGAPGGHAKAPQTNKLPTKKPVPTTTTTVAPPAGAQPKVLSVGAAEPALAAVGGYIVVSAKVKDATSCQLHLLSHQAFPVTYNHGSLSCARGGLLAHIEVGPNTKRARQPVVFALVARNGKLEASGKFYISVAAFFPAQVECVTLTPRTMTAAGGEAKLSVALKHATTCKLRLLSRQDIPVSAPEGDLACANGQLHLGIRVGQNPGPTKRVISFALVAHNNASSASARFSVVIGPRATPKLTITPRDATVPLRGGKVMFHVAMSALPKSRCSIVTRDKNAGGAGDVTPFNCSGGGWTGTDTVTIRPGAANTFYMVVEVSGPGEQTVTATATITQAGVPRVTKRPTTTTTRPRTTTTRGKPTTTTSAVTTTTAPSTATTSITTTTTASPANACHVFMSVPVGGDAAEGQPWGWGVQVDNVGQAPVSGWEVTWALPGATLWPQGTDSAVVTQSGDTFTATNTATNGTIAAGVGVNFGVMFTGGYQSAPSFTCTFTP